MPSSSPAASARTSAEARAAWMTAAAHVETSVGALGRTHVGGDLTLHPGSTWQASVSADGDSALLSADGTIRLGAATIALDASGGAYPRVLQTALVTATGGVLGQPVITTAAPALESHVTSDGRTVFLTVLNTEASLAAAATGANGAAVGGAFDRLRSSSAGDLWAVTRELAALSDADLARSLDAASGDAHATALQLAAFDADAAADRVRGEVSRRRQPASSMRSESALTAGDPLAPAWRPGVRWWGDLGGQRVRLDATAAAHEARGHLGGFALGVDWTPGGAWLVGAGGGYALGELTLAGGDSDVDTTAPRAFGYVGYGRHRWTLQAGATLGRTTYRTRRHVAFAARLDPRFGTQALFDGVDRTAESASAGLDTGVWVDARVEVTRGSWRLQPGVGVRTARYGRGAWAETGADALALTAAAQAVRSTQADLGVRVVRAVGRLRPAASATYRREFGAGATPLTLQLSPDAAGRFTVHGVPFAANRLIGTLGLVMDAWSFGYRVDTGGGQARHAVDLGVRFD